MSLLRRLRWLRWRNLAAPLPPSLHKKMAATLDRRFTPARLPEFAALSLQGSVDAKEFRNPVRMKIEREFVNISPVAAMDCPIDTQALFGEEIDVFEIDESTGWAWGQLVNDQYVGYLPKSALVDSNFSSTASSNQSSTTSSTPSSFSSRILQYVSVIRTFLYAAPNMKLPPIMALPMGAHIEWVKDVELFSEIRLSSGLAYVWKSHLRQPQLPSSSFDYVSIAEKFIGVPYLWGGKTSCGIDCSGLVQVSLAATGRQAPRDSDVMQSSLGWLLPHDQVARMNDFVQSLVILNCDSVSLDGEEAEEKVTRGLQRGDLVFWRGHVGIMFDSKTLLHATGFHMLVVKEPLLVVCSRMLAEVPNPRPITAIKRLTEPQR